MKTYIVFFLLFLAAFTSCKDYLEFPPEKEVPTTEFFKTQADAEMAVNAMYGFLRTWDISAFNYLILGSLPSADIIKGSVTVDGPWANAYMNFQYTKDQQQIREFWQGRYKGINLSNQVISNVPGIDMPQAAKDRFVADAKFLRAFHYFYLVRAFGGVPIVDKVPVGPEGMVRASLDATWSFIIQDLNDAIAGLPETVPSAEYGRATRWAAKALLAKVYMYTENWSGCKSLTDEIINSGPFDLYPSFYQLFRPEQEFCEESIFEIVSTQVVGNNDLSNCQFSETQAIREPSNGGWAGWGWFAPSDKLAKAFDDAGDTVRKKVTILFYHDVTEDGDSILGIPLMDGVEVPRYNGKSYVPKRIPWLTGANGCDQNIRILRFAEVLLMNAEAAIHAGGDAAAPLNRVRARANLPAIASPTLQNIWDERRLELAGENDRFWDLVRTGQAATFLAEYGYVEPKNRYYPIPQAEVDLSAGSLEQNPGW